MQCVPEVGGADLVQGGYPLDALWHEEACSS